MRFGLNAPHWKMVSFKCVNVMVNVYVYICVSAHLYMKIFWDNPNYFIDQYWNKCCLSARTNYYKYLILPKKNCYILSINLFTLFLNTVVVFYTKFNFFNAFTVGYLVRTILILHNSYNNYCNRDCFGFEWSNIILVLKITG